MKHLEGKVAIITGGAGGIGSGLCRTFAAQGAKVIVSDTGGDVEGRTGLDTSRVDGVVDAIKAEGGEAIATAGDIADMDYAESVVRLALDTYGKLDILVCAHGILRERMIFNMTEDEWDEVIRVHLKGCFAVTKFASIYWRQAKTGGRIVYFTSDAGIFGSPGQPNYSAAHAGKLGLMRSNVGALGRYGVTTNCIAPLASTRMTDRGLATRAGAASTSDAATGTARDPMNVAPIAVWLASDDGGAVSGRIFGAGGHRVSVYYEPVQERVLKTREPFVDIDWLFENWDATIGNGAYYPPKTVRNMPRPAQPAQG